uniref:Tonsoku-like protein n=1 Tax=Naja naja TaxID=35670 RepID=A0A8C6XTM6_NAJNA
KKAYRLGSWKPQQQDSIGHNLPTKVSRLQEALEEAEAASDLGAALGLSEQLGDLFCKVGEYRRAAEAYEKQLGHAQALGRTEQELAVIHVSLAATYGDLKDYVRAVQHYQAELALRRGNPLEEGKTWLNIALAKEEAGKSYPELEPCFQAALQAAQKAGDHKLELQTLRHLQASQQRCGCPAAAMAETSAHLQAVCASHDRHSDGESSEEEELHNSQALEASDPELSDSGESLMGDVGEDVGSFGPGQWNQRNDKGETLLHRACIEGNLRQVQLPFLFLCQEHPVNPRDYCGWTPLHEACNHGHLETVRLLLDHGASIDDPGGPDCEGITPELLIQRGASMLLRNAKGLSPLGTLQAWVQLYGKDLDSETHHQCRAMESLLRKTMAEQGEAPQVPCSPSPPPKPPSARQCQQEADEDYMVSLRPVKKKQRLLDQALAGEAGPAPPADYQAAMLGLGSAPLRLPPSPKRHKGPPRPALIPADEYVGDDWLEDDLAPSTGSRKRSHRSPAGAWGSGSEDSEGGAPCQPPEDSTRRRRRKPACQTRLTLGRTLLGRKPGGLWLAEQASQLLPDLAPAPHPPEGGALLAPQDSILDALQSNEEVLAEVQSWDLPPLLERYRKACQTLAVGKQPACFCTARPRPFSASAWPPRQLSCPLLRALKLQASLRQLCLSGTGLGTTAEELQATLGTIPGLKHLDLSANWLGPDGLQKLAAGLPAPLLSSLEELDLSLNPLGDGFANTGIDSPARALGAGLYDLPGPPLPNSCSSYVSPRRSCAPQEAHSVPQRPGLPWLGVLLKSLPFESLTHLEVGSLEPRLEDRPQLRDAVVRYLTQEGCALSHLGLSGNHLDDDDVAELARSLLVCPSLASLDLSANPAISILGLRTLLVTLEERKQGLQSLNLAGELAGGRFFSIASWLLELLHCGVRIPLKEIKVSHSCLQGCSSEHFHLYVKHFNHPSPSQRGCVF